MKTATITLADKDYTVSCMTTDQYFDLQEMPAGRQQVLSVVAWGLAEHHPEMTIDAIKELRVSYPQIIAAQRIVMDLCGLTAQKKTTAPEASSNAAS